MAMTREQKSRMVQELAAGIGEASNAFLIEFKGVSVPQITELRRQIRETESHYLVIKNTLALIAIQDSPMVELRSQFTGPTAVAYNSGDAVALAKALTRFAKDVPGMTFKGAMLDRKVVPAEQIDTIANLPSREELVAKLLYLMQFPIQGLVNVLQANIRNLAVVIDQIAKQRSGGTTAEE